MAMGVRVRQNWAEELLAVSERSDENQLELFRSLVDEVVGKCNIDVARTLMKTFTSNPDHGWTQEGVYNVLSSAEMGVYLQALLEELPRLVSEVPLWAEMLFVRAQFKPEMVRDIAQRMPRSVRRALREVVSAPSIEPPEFNRTEIRRRAERDVERGHCHALTERVVAVLIVAAILWMAVARPIVDSCLDAGGRYDYSAKRCEFGR